MTKNARGNQESRRRVLRSLLRRRKARTQQELVAALERKGYLSSRVGGATSERGGRRKRFFTITPVGIKALEATRADREEMWNLVEGSP